MNATIYDAQLHTLRSIADAVKQVDPLAGNHLKAARNNLFAALDTEDFAAAREWLTAFETCVLSYCDDLELKKIAREACEAIEEKIALLPGQIAREA